VAISVGLKHWQIESSLKTRGILGGTKLGRRRRRVIKIVKKKLPTVFTCPSCSQDAMKVTMSKSAGKATVHCASCGLKEEVDAPPSFDMVDVYCSFADAFYLKTRAPQ
jgi:transcription elongation factor Elf1